MTLSHRIRRAALVPLLGLLTLAFGAVLAHAASIVIINNNAPGVGFNDPTPAAAAPGNPGLTLGDQRLYIFNYAAAIWGALLPDAVEIDVRAQFSALSCTATSATLGSTGATTIHRDFAGALYAGTWYVQSLANKLAGTDLSAANPDMNTTFNSALDAGSATCLGGLRWYYGTDGNEGVNVELLPVVVHELAHGLGFATSTNGTSGNYSSGFPSIYDRFLRDNATGNHWSDPAETAAQRVASAISVNGLSWDGPAVFSFASSFLAHRPRFHVNAPAGIAGYYNLGTASFGPSLTAGGLTGDVVLADDDTVPDPNDACEAIVNGAALVGKVALIDRGTCTFVSKALAAQGQGAIAVIIVNNAAGSAPAMGGSDPTVMIPVISVSQSDGAIIKAQLGAGVNVTMDLDPVLLAGADDSGRPLMYAPNPFQGGSSVSHWDVNVTPNALMEPAINQDLHNSVDMTYPHFDDIGWFPHIVATTLSMFTAAGRSDGILLRWQFGDLTDIGAVTVQRASSSDGPWAPISTESHVEAGVTMALDTEAAAATTYFYRLRVMDRSGAVQTLGLASAQRLALPSAGVFLSVPSPNPTSRAASVTFRIDRPEFVRLSIVDLSGRKVATLHEGMLLAGEYTRTWDAQANGSQKAAPGVYFVSLRTSRGVQTQRLALAN